MLFALGSAYVAYRAGHLRKLETWRRAAKAGNPAAVASIAHDNSSDASSFLANLAQDRNADADVRVAAIDGLGSRKTLRSDALAVLLSIREPFEIRQATADVFARRGCDDTCVSATLYALYELWSGQPPMEMTLATEADPKFRPKLLELARQFHESTMTEYTALLRQNACTVANLLRTDYARQEDAAFAAEIRTKIGGCIPPQEKR